MSLECLGAVCVGAKPYVAVDPDSYLGKVAGNGQCVSLVKDATGAPPSSEWSQGKQVRGETSIAPGTAIATFQDGKYWNRTDGTSHGAIYMSQDKGGIYVIDQWRGQPAHARYIRFKDGKEHPVNDGDAFSVVVAGAPRGFDPRTQVGIEVLPSDDGSSQADLIARMQDAERKNAASTDLRAVGVFAAVAAAAAIVGLWVARFSR